MNMKTVALFVAIIAILSAWKINELDNKKVLAYGFLIVAIGSLIYWGN